MANKQRIKLGDTEVDAFEVEFEIVREEWNEYRLLDGGRVRVRATVEKMFRVLDAEGKPAFTPEGDPNILIRHNTRVIASI